MFAERYGAREIEAWLAPRREYRPIPTVEEREPWEGLAGEVRAAAREAGEELLGFEWPRLPAREYMEFARTGDRAGYERPYFRRRSALGSLVVAECAEGKGRFLDDIVNGVWAICEESSWVVPAHNTFSGRGEALPDVSDPYIDLFAGDTGALLAWCHYLLASRLEGVSGRVCERVRREVKARILDPFLGHEDFWWMGGGDRWRLNNWSPWCVSNCLAAFLLLEEEEGRRRAAVGKAMGILDRFLAGYHADGGCDEGPGYWTVAGGALFDCLELLGGATGGRVGVYDEPLIREIGRYIYRVHISGEYYVNFADCGAKVAAPGGLVYRYGRRIEDEGLAGLGAWVHGRQGARAVVGGKLLRALPDLFHAEGMGEAAEPPYVRDVWLDGIEVMAAREREGTERGLYLAAKGGHNDESHNHNDVGHFIIYLDGEPGVIDVGVGTYTAKTFSDERYEIWTMRSAYHNLPTVRGVEQGAGDEFRAREVRYGAEEEVVEFGLDISGAYPEAAGIRRWRRTWRLRRGEVRVVEMADEFALEGATEDITLSLMTAGEPVMEGPGALRVRAGEGILRIRYDAEALSAQVEAMELDDARLRGWWGERVYRVVLRARAATAGARWVTRVEAV